MEESNKRDKGDHRREMGGVDGSGSPLATTGGVSALGFSEVVREEP